jgi:hypothetical protein
MRILHDLRNVLHELTLAHKVDSNFSATRFCPVVSWLLKSCKTKAHVSFLDLFRLRVVQPFRLWGLVLQNVPRLCPPELSLGFYLSKRLSAFFGAGHRCKLFARHLTIRLLISDP